MKHLIILNQKAGAEKNVEKFQAQIKEDFKGLDYEVYLTTGPRSVIPFLKEYLSKNNDVLRVYACGGDGTIHEVVNAIVGYRSINQIVIVREASLRTVCIHKVHPVFSGRVVK